MTPAAWRELIESYAAGRLSADSFKRRFLEAFDAAATVPPAIQELYYTVDAYGGDPTGRGHDVADDATLMVAARRALLRLAPAEAQPGGPAPGVGDEDGPTIEIRMGAPPRPPLRTPPGLMAGMGIGCAVMGLWFAVAVLQVFAIAEQVDRVLDIGPVLATGAALVLTFIPIIGSVVAYFGASDGWGWAPWVAALVFLAFPIATQAASFLMWRARRER